MYPSKSSVTQVMYCFNILVPTSQSEVTVMQSHDDQPRQGDERSQVGISNGMYASKINTYYLKHCRQFVYRVKQLRKLLFYMTGVRKLII